MHRATLALLLTMFVPLSVRGEDKPPLKAGIIGLDTSHVVAFTKTLNNPKAEGDLARVRVVAAYPGGSPDIPDSRDRVEGLHENAARQVSASRSSIRSTPC